MKNMKTRTKTQTQVNKQGVTPAREIQTHNAAGVKKKKNREIVKMGTSNPDQYRTALMSPFSESALGSRVPDQFFAPTATVALREIVSLGNDTSGNIECMLLPNMYNPAVSFRSNITNGTTLTCSDGTTYTNGMIQNSTTPLWSKLVNYRIVSWGLRIRNTTAVTNAAGVLTVALLPVHTRCRVPSQGPIGGQNAAGTGAGNLNAQNWYQSVGLPYNGTTTSARLDLSSLLDLPYHARYQGTQLAEQTFEIHPKIVSPESMQFRNSADSNWGSDMQATTSAVYVQPGDASYLMMDGWTTVVLGFQGGSGTANTQTFEVELIYHLEGSPNVGPTTVFITDAPVSIHNPMVAMVAQAALNSAPAFTRVGGAAMAALRAFAGA